MSATWKTCCSNIPQRWVVVIMCFSGLFNAYAMRICLSIAITQMVLPANNTIEFIDDTCPDSNVTDVQFNNGSISYSGLFDWSEYTQGIILSSFYWGYIFTNLPGGIIAARFGGKYTLGLGILCTAALTVLTPFAIAWGGSTSLICLRVLMGLGEGTTYPALCVLMAHWVPENERSKAASVAFSGAPLGTIFGTMASGVILRYSPMGWPAVFYFFGGVGFLAFILNSAFCYNKPSEHPFITAEEAKYLKDTMKDTHAIVPPTPWRHILKSMPVWALIIVTIGNAWGFLTMVSDMPKYMSSVLKFSVQNNGYLSSLPYLCMWINGCITSWIADWLIASKRMTISRVRKIGSTIASLGPGVFLVAASYAGCDDFLVVVLLTVGMTLMGCSAFSILTNPLDLGPNYTGIVMGLVNAISTLSGIISPYVVGVITPNQTISEWRAVFWIVLVVFLVSNTIFLIFGSGELQYWNDPDFLAREKRSSESDVKEGIQLLTIKQNSQI